MEKLKELDHALFLELNSYHSPFWDAVMVTISNKYVWFPFYGILIGLLIYFYKRRGLLMVLCMGASVGLADYISSGILKPWVGRLRPCHDELLNSSLNVIDGCGGKFGFVSSHAANAFAVAFFLVLLLPPKQWFFKALLILWAVSISYSRIYLGVHFPGDVIGGTLIGIAAAQLAFYLNGLFYQKYPFWQK